MVQYGSLTIISSSTLTCTSVMIYILGTVLPPRVQVCMCANVIWHRKGDFYHAWYHVRYHILYHIQHHIWYQIWYRIWYHSWYCTCMISYMISLCHRWTLSHWTMLKRNWGWRCWFDKQHCISLLSWKGVPGRASSQACLPGCPSRATKHSVCRWYAACCARVDWVFVLQIPPDSLLVAYKTGGLDQW